MRAVWSFWSRPHRAHYHARWYSEQHHLLAWALSVETARRHYPDTVLVTDSAGARLLVDRLGLPFSRVDLSLDRLDAESRDDGWWVLGKLMAYAAQDAPFVHLDADVFLWRPLPARLTAAPVLAQNPETFRFEDPSLYRLDPFLRGIRVGAGWLPPEWRAFARARGTDALCCGIFGGSDLDFIRHYAQSAMRVVLHPRNQPVWPGLGVRDNILVEQYFLAACLAHHADRAGSPFEGVRVECLFPSSAAAFDPQAAEAAGYTHLIGDAKAHPEIAERLARRVRRDHPELYDLCLRALAHS